MESPHFFVDRSLGRVRVPQLLRADAWALTTLAEHYGVPGDEKVDDVKWLTMAGRAGWAVLMKDEKIRYRAVERESLIDAGVTAFCLTSGNLRADEMAQCLIRLRSQIWTAADEAGPALFAVSRRQLRRIDL